MAKVIMNIDTREAVETILDVAAILNDKFIVCGENAGPQTFGNGGYQVLERALVMAASAIDFEHFNGELTRDIPFVWTEDE